MAGGERSGGSGKKVVENLLSRALPLERATGMHYAEAGTACGSLRLAATLGDKELTGKLGEAIMS